MNFTDRNIPLIYIERIIVGKKELKQNQKIR
jgi:hypothetical protein